MPRIHVCVASGHRFGRTSRLEFGLDQSLNLSAYRDPDQRIGTGRPTLSEFTVHQLYAAILFAAEIGRLEIQLKRCAAYEPAKLAFKFL